jgi:uroporphyrinogen decarboxylase
VTLPQDHPLVDGRTTQSPLVRAYRGDRMAHPPIWFPGHAGGDGHAVGGDILQLAGLAGVPVRFEAGRGPVVDQPIRTPSDVLALRPLDPDVLTPITTRVREAVADLPTVPLIAVAVAPFTLAALLVEGGPSSDQLRARAMMYADPHAWAGLLNWCADVAGAVLRAQVVAGASAAQLVDPSMGSLSRRDYQRRVAPHSRRAFDVLRGLDVPRVHVGAGTGDVLDLLAGIGATVIGVDWRVPLDEANERIGGTAPLQGNLDPALLFAPWRTLAAHVDDVLLRGASAPAHVVTVGGDLPSDVDAAVLARIERRVRGEDDD